MSENKKIPTDASLSAFLGYFGFDYEIRTDGDEDKYIALIDKEGGNLGDIEGDRFYLNHDPVSQIVDRLSIYIGQ